MTALRTPSENLTFVRYLRGYCDAFEVVLVCMVGSTPVSVLVRVILCGLEVLTCVS